MTYADDADTGEWSIGLWTTEPAERDRLTALVRILMVIPQYIVLFFVGIAAFVIVVVGWFGALFTGRLPDFAEDFLSGYLRWVVRVEAYLWFLTDEYPPFTLAPAPAYPVQLELPPATDLNRLAVLFRIILVIPAAIVAGVLWTGLGVVSIVSWASIVFTGAMPQSIYEAARVAVRYHTRYAGYFWMLTPEYAWGVYGDATGPLAPVPGVSGVDGTDQTVGNGRWLALTSRSRTAITVMLVLGAVLDIVYRSRVY